MSYRNGIALLGALALLAGIAWPLRAEESGAKKVGELRYSGVVLPLHQVTMQPNMVTGASAQVVKVLFEENDLVKKKQLLVQLDNREAVIAQKITEQQVEAQKVQIVSDERTADYQAKELSRMIEGGQAIAEAQKAEAQARYDLVKINIDLDKAKLEAYKLQVDQAKKRLEDYEIRAPFDGVISMKAVEEGQTVESTTKVCEVLEVAQVLATISVENDYFGAIKEGDPVTVTIEALPGRTFSATVHSKGAVADPRSKTFIVKIKIDNKDNAIKPGWYADVIFPAKVAAAKPGK